MTGKRRRGDQGGGRVTLKQIAEESGLPIMTVSRALRGLRGEVSEASLQRALEVANRLGYRPNLLVKALQTGHSQNIGVVVPPISSFAYDLIRGVHDELVKDGCLPLVHWQNPVPGGATPERMHAAELEVIHRLLDRRVDGVIFLPSDDLVFDLHFQEVWKRDIPLVAVDRFLKHSSADFVGTDDAAGGRLAAEHLLALGHRRFAQLAGALRVGPFADRRQVFEATVRAAGAECRTHEVDISDLTTITPRSQALLADPFKPTAVFLGADHFAPPFYTEARRLGLSVPRDLSVIGFADLDYSVHLGLTTVRQHPYEIGVRAARIVLDRCAGRLAKDEPIVERLMPELVIRQSTAPAPA